MPVGSVVLTCVLGCCFYSRVKLVVQEHYESGSLFFGQKGLGLIHRQELLVFYPYLVNVPVVYIYCWSDYGLFIDELLNFCSKIDLTGSYIKLTLLLSSRNNHR